MNTTLRGPAGQVVGYVQQQGNNRTQILDRNQRLVAREVNNRTFDRVGKFVGNGSQGIRLLGK
jgi:hypothetical protein